MKGNWKERVLVQESQNNHPDIRLMILVTVFTRKSYHLWETIPKYSWLSSKIFIFIQIVGRESQYCAWLVPAPPDWHPPRLSSLCLNLWIQLGRQEKRNEQQFWTSFGPRECVFCPHSMQNQTMRSYLTLQEEKYWNQLVYWQSLLEGCWMDSVVRLILWSLHNWWPSKTLITKFVN